MDSLDIYEILEHLPHRYPFLLVDRVIDCKVGESLKAIKNVSYNEPYFQGHFPHRPVMPGVLVLEALAQATGILAFRTTNSRPTERSLYYFVGIDKARFKQPVVPGDQLILEVKVLRTVKGVWKFSGEACVDGKVVTSATLMCAERDVEP
ncbi:MAG: 3-hydroxyacyl-ACP dehydratase FabZ [Gammaproteobacteria bacterium]|nr:3-hydroxyacyl-ACP dehydratase FabZ [Gammaproteobacteria bacterium]